MRSRNLTREERGRRKLRIVYLIWAVFTAAVLLCAIFSTEEPTVTVTDTVTHAHTHTVTATPIVSVEPVIDETLELMEDELIEAALIEQGYYRDDIRLTYLEQDFLHTAVDSAGVPYELALAVIWKETNFRNVVGDDGASVGYMQVQERWHRERMERLGVTDLSDPYGNFLVGCDYLAEMLEKDRGTEWALMAYNGGLNYANKMAKAGKVSKYATDVLNYMNDLKMEEK